MCAVSRMVKAGNPEAITVFVGPLYSQKDEAKRNPVRGNADYVLTIGEFRSMMKAKGVKFETR